MRTRFIFGLCCLTLFPPVLAEAAPPPPAPPLPEAEQLVGGYPMQPIFEQWRRWVESRKGVAVDSILAEPEAVEGYRPFGPVLLRFESTNDFGRFTVGEVRIYCRPDGASRVVRESCH